MGKMFINWYSNCNLEYMKQFVLTLHILLLCQIALAQQEFHVFPNISITENGDGSIQKPWDLQTALNQNSTVVNGGDTIWLHKGVYNGRFISNISSTVEGKFITVMPYRNERVILNGNVASNNKQVLEVRGANVTFKDFEVTFLGDFPRHVKEFGFLKVDGINHTSGHDNKFINLKIYNNPGSGFGSWKFTGGSVVYGCKIYNNGFFSNARGSGAGIYVQNISEKTREIENNIIFNNYYMGIEAWSASTNADAAYVKNILLKDNVVFNNGSPGNHYKNNLIVATDDKNGINRATNIKVLDNVFYHNADISNTARGDAASLTLGANSKAPLKNVEVKGNVIIGGNNSLRFDNAENLVFENNLVYAGYVHLNKSILSNISGWTFNNNKYFSKNSRNFRIINHKDYTFDDWKSSFKKDSNSQWNTIKQFNSDAILNVTQNEYNENSFRLALMDVNGESVIVDFSSYNFPPGIKYKIVDVENPNKILSEGTLPLNSKVEFIMHLTEFEKPLHNDYAKKTLSNFGVFEIEFQPENTHAEQSGWFGRFFKWLGF